MQLLSRFFWYVIGLLTPDPGPWWAGKFVSEGGDVERLIVSAPDREAAGAKLRQKAAKMLRPGSRDYLMEEIWGKFGSEEYAAIVKLTNHNRATNEDNPRS